MNTEHGETMPLVNVTSKQLKILEAVEKRPPRGSGAQTSRERAVAARPQGGTPAINLKKDFSAGKKACGRCGRKNHEDKDCYFKSSVCNLCGKTGHIARACHSKKKEGGSEDKKENKKGTASNKSFAEVLKGTEAGKKEFPWVCKDCGYMCSGRGENGTCVRYATSGP